MADDLSWDYQDSDDENSTNDNYFRLSGKTALLCIIDCSPQMFEIKNEQIPFLTAIKCCQSLWRSKIVSSPKDKVSILLNYTKTEDDENRTDLKNMYLLQPLQTLKVEMIQELFKIHSENKENSCSKFLSTIGSSNDYNMMDLFWKAKLIFDQDKANEGFIKKIIYFTYNDNPHEDDHDLQSDSIKKFKDLGPVDFNIVTFNDEFNFQLFYHNICDDESRVTFAENLDSLKKILRIKQRPKRPICRSTLELAPGIEMAIGVYKLVRQEGRPRPVYVNKRNNEILEKETKVFHSDTGIPILKSEERKTVQVQGQTVVFTPQEVKKMKEISKSGFKVLGYIDATDFDYFKWFKSDGYFLHPDDERIEGSKDLFVTLLKRCHALKKLVLVQLVLTRGRSPKLAALIPCLNTGESSSSVSFPQGFFAMPLPFSDEMRSFEQPETVQASEELENLMCNYVKKVTNKSIDLSEIQNPALQHIWRQLEQYAFEGELPEDPDDEDEFFDYTDPDVETIESRTAEIASEINTFVDSKFGQQESSTFARSRSTQPVKSEKEMRIEAKKGRLEKLTVQILKDFCDSVNLTTARDRLRKAELVEKVYQHFGIDH